jgi:EpsI family protein
MNGERLATHGLVVAMFAVAAITWWFQLRPALEFDAARLGELPLRLGAWEGEPVPLESTVERMLRADLNVQRTYRSVSAPEVIWMYVGYYGTRRGGRPEHTPDVCYPSAGWRIESNEVWASAAAPELRANEMLVSRRGQRRLVHYWYRSARSPVLLGLLPVSVDQLSGRLSNGRADGALVTLSTPLADGALEPARERLLDLRRPLEGELAERWPNETPAR